MVKAQGPIRQYKCMVKAERGIKREEEVTSAPLSLETCRKHDVKEEISTSIQVNIEASALLEMAVKMEDVSYNFADVHLRFLTDDPKSAGAHKIDRPSGDATADAQAQQQMQVPKVEVDVRKSGIAGISWHRWNKAWKVQSLGAKRIRKTVSIGHLVRSGMSRGEAIQEALRRAVALKKDLERQGYVFGATKGEAKYQSQVCGVCWKASSRAWQLPSVFKKRFKGDSLRFKPKDTSEVEVAAARELAEQAFAELARKHGHVPRRKRDFDAFPEKLASGVKGVSWTRGAWRSEVRHKGSVKRKRFLCASAFADDMERARLQAAAWVAEHSKKRG